MELLDAIYASLDAGDLDKANKLALELYKDDKNRNNAIELLVSIAIEAGNIELALRRAVWLDEIPVTIYRVFLKARVLFLANHKGDALKYLESVNNPGIIDGASKEIQEKVYNLLGQCYRFLGYPAKAAEAYYKAYAIIDNPQLKILEYSNYLFNLHYLPISKEEYFHAHEQYNELFKHIEPFVHSKSYKKKNKLRIGYISPDFRNHVVLRFTYVMLTAYDKNSFEVYCYSTGREDEYSSALRDGVDVWRSLQGHSAENIANIIHDDEIDILVELSGHCSGGGLPVLAYKPAPVQICGIGYFATTGLRTVDYFLTDDNINTEAEYFTENLLNLKHSHFCYTPLYSAPLLKKTPCIRNKYITFGSFNNLTKVTDEVLEVWSELLHRVPNSHLLLKGSLFDDEIGLELFKQRMLQFDFDLNRVELRGISRDYLIEYLDMDIALDTFPYPGGGTTCDALYMGVPVISLLDGTHGGNFGGSILRNVGLEACCTYSKEEYIERAVEFANDHELLKALHLGLRNMMESSPIMDKGLYMSELEDAYQKIWKKYQQNKISRREITVYFQNLKKAWSKGNIEETLGIADMILDAKPISSNVLKTLLEIYIDTGKKENADIVADMLSDGKKSDGYTFFLLGRNSELQGRYFNSITFAENAINTQELSGDLLAYCYDMLGRVYRALALPDKAAEYHLLAAKSAEDVDLKKTTYSNYLFTLHFIKCKPEFMLRAATEYSKIMPKLEAYKHNYEEYEKVFPYKQKIRIGYLSSDLKQHVVAEFVQAFFSKYDKYTYEVYVYANCKENEFAAEMSNLVDSWKYVYRLNSREIAAQIKQDEIHILVELGGHTANNCLEVLAYRPAPIQICGIGYFGSTGLEEVDYFLGDSYLDSYENSPNFVEKILRLEHSHWCYRPLNADNTGLAEFGCNYVGDPCKTASAPFQKNGYITFGCFNAFQKLNVDMLRAWQRILIALPQAKLMLKGGAYFNPDQRQRMIDMCKEVELPLDRIILEDRTADYMSAYNKVDIILDTFPYVGGGTTCDALYMGVPVITLYGDDHHSRFGYSAIMNIGGMEDCCASSVDEYVNKAIILGKNLKRIKYLHKTIRRRMEMSPLMDAGKYMADLENSYSTIWQKYTNHFLPETNEFCSNNAYEYLKRFDHDRADWWIKKAIELGGDNLVELHCYLAQSAIHRLDNYTAWQEVNKAFHSLETEENQGTVGFRLSLYNNRGHFAKLMGCIDEAAESYLKTVEISQSLYEKSQSYGNYLYSILCSTAEYSFVREKHFEYNDMFTELRKQICSLAEERTEAFAKRKHEKIRVGYMSPDFRQHVMFSFYYALLSQYDKNSFWVKCYQLTSKQDSFTEHLKTLADEWQQTSGLSIEDIANLIYDDEIDILVDLAGHTANSGLPVFVYRPAPVQITGLGWMETTGLEETDYFITDRYVDPKYDNYLMEAPLYLSSQFCYVGRNDVPKVNDAPSTACGYITFGVFNNWYKINDNILGLWKRIMERVPKSVLLLKCQLFISLSAQEHVFQRMYRLGFDIDRVVFEPATDNYMNRYLSVDIALDTYPYPGGGTTCDALYMGVPVVSLYGKRRGSRFGYSILENMGLGELATDDPDRYVDIAVALAEDKNLLSYLHKNIRKMLQESPVMDTKLYMKQIQEQYRHCLQQIKENGK